MLVRTPWGRISKDQRQSLRSPSVAYHTQPVFLFSGSDSRLDAKLNEGAAWGLTLASAVAPYATRHNNLNKD
eukprot:344226-Amphidinium_carterae.1